MRPARRHIQQSVGYDKKPTLESALREGGRLRVAEALEVDRNRRDTVGDTVVSIRNRVGVCILEPNAAQDPSGIPGCIGVVGASCPTGWVRVAYVIIVIVVVGPLGFHASIEVLIARNRHRRFTFVERARLGVDLHVRTRVVAPIDTVVSRPLLRSGNGIAKLGSQQIQRHPGVRTI